ACVRRLTCVGVCFPSLRVFYSLPAPRLPLPFLFPCRRDPRDLHSFPTRRSSDLPAQLVKSAGQGAFALFFAPHRRVGRKDRRRRSEEHTSELQSRFDLVCRLLLEKKK